MAKKWVSGNWARRNRTAVQFPTGEMKWLLSFLPLAAFGQNDLLTGNTILDAGTVSRAWIDAVRAGAPLHASAPAAWRTWVEKGVYEPLTAEPTIEYRTREEQLPAAGRDESLVRPAPPISNRCGPRSRRITRSWRP